jgi:hypothetical protein
MIPWASDGGGPSDPLPDRAPAWAQEAAGRLIDRFFRDRPTVDRAGIISVLSDDYPAAACALAVHFTHTDGPQPRSTQYTRWMWRAGRISGGRALAQVLAADPGLASRIAATLERIIACGEGARTPPPGAP